MPIRRRTSTKRKKTPDAEWRDLDRFVQSLKRLDLVFWDLKFETASKKKPRRKPSR